ncbi:unnamed protein product [Fraxinus pennsylvanica]|uniref:Uncharacterized protein n=1 Tax=Fraxinus pennsylvanica TaxID=56036 RepID=A0AAD1YNZ7_9LAMI|nr:unnamed protein product [Fraxinus pennsylvanica]
MLVPNNFNAVQLIYQSSSNPIVLPLLSVSPSQLSICLNSAKAIGCTIVNIGTQELIEGRICGVTASKNKKTLGLQPEKIRWIKLKSEDSYSNTDYIDIYKWRITKRMI